MLELPSASTNATSLKQFTNALARADLTSYLQIRSMLLCVIMLRCHVSGVLMSRGVRDDLYLSLYLVSVLCAPKFMLLVSRVPSSIRVTFISAVQLVSTLSFVVSVTVCHRTVLAVLTESRLGILSLGI